MRNFFQFDQLGTNYKREIIGGLTTFLSMAYILIVNPLTLTLQSVPDLPDSMRMDYGAVFVATALAAAIGSLIMGLIAKYPIALAPGMGLNAFFAYTVVLTMGVPWQSALTGVLISGLIFIALTLSGIREKIINSIPAELKYAVGAGIGLFITFIGFQNAGIIVNNDAVLVGLGDLTKGTTLLAIFGIIITVILMTRGVKGGIFIGMVVTAIVGMIAGLIDTPERVVDAAPSLAPTFGAALEPLFNDAGSIFTIQMLVVILTFLFVDFFDTAGTLVAVANQAGLDEREQITTCRKSVIRRFMCNCSRSHLRNIYHNILYRIICWGRSRSKDRIRIRRDGHLIRPFDFLLPVTGRHHIGRDGTCPDHCRSADGIIIR